MEVVTARVASALPPRHDAVLGSGIPIRVSVAGNLTGMS